MLIQSGRVSTLSSRPWVALEIGHESQPDEIALNLVRWAVEHLESQSKAFQILYPVESRDPIALASPHFWMRVSDLSDLSPLARGGIRGMQNGNIRGIVSDSHGHPIPVDDAFVQALISRVRAASDSWSDGISTGSGVRILLGSGHGLCGTVEHLAQGEATIRIALRSRAIRLKVPVRALRNLGAAPSDYFVKEDL